MPVICCSAVLSMSLMKEIVKSAKEMLLVNSKLHHFVLLVKNYVRKQENSLMISGSNHQYLINCWHVLNIPENYKNTRLRNCI